MSSSSTWDVGSRSGLVSIGTHNLHLRAAGSDGKPGEPVAIIIQGLASCASSWAAVVRLLNAHIRVYSYDRSGFGESELSPLLPTTTNIVHELGLLLQSADIKPPYIFVAHSWGAILIREYIALGKEDEIAGIVFVEPNQEKTLELSDWRPFMRWVISNNVKPNEALMLEYRRRLTNREWRTYQEDEVKVQQTGQGEAEFKQYAESFPLLASKKQLDRETPLLSGKPVCIVKGNNVQDFRLLYDVVELKLGGDEDAKLEHFRKFVEGFDRMDWELQTEMQKLSWHSHVIHADKSGHNIQLTQPELIVEAVTWVAKK